MTAARLSILDSLEVREEDRRLEQPRIAAVKASLPSDRSFDGYELALAHVTGAPLPPDTELVVAQGMLDVLIEYPIESATSRFSIHPSFRHLGLQVLTVLRFLPVDKPERALSLHDDPGLVRLDPNWFQAARLFTVQGFFHILEGIDHLLFVLCLVIPFRRFVALVPIVTAFTIAHSVTLIASAYDMAPGALWFPPLVETLIAASIVYMALENIIAPGLKRRWMIAFGFGLIHGFGFSFALREELQLAGSHVLTSLVSFNVGVELGQLVALVVFIPALGQLFRRVMPERIGTIILSALVAHTGWHWMIDRGSQLLRYQFTLPAFDAAFFVLVLRWMIIALVLAAAGWVFSGLRNQRRRSEA